MAAGYTGVIDWEHNIPPVQETKMFKNRFLLVLGIVSLLLVTMAVSNPAPDEREGASDFYQRHPDWTWVPRDQNVVSPVTGEAAFPDYYQRHPEQRIPVEISSDTTDYFFRHSELRPSAAEAIDLTDYFFRHPELGSD